MTNNPREQAIDVIAVLVNKEHPHSLGYSQCRIIAEIALDALNIEIVSKESEPQNVWDTTIWAVSYEKKTITFRMPENFRAGWDNYYISLNAKPAVYVENIGVKL